MKLFMILTRRINSYTATNRLNLQMYEWVLTGGLKYNKSFAIALIWLHCLSSLISWKEWCLWMSTTVGNVLGSFSPSYKQCIITGPNVDRKCCNFPYKRIHALVTDLCEIMVFQATGLWYQTGTVGVFFRSVLRLHLITANFICSAVAMMPVENCKS